jgi:hypothetical protein
MAKQGKEAYGKKTTQTSRGRFGVEGNLATVIGRAGASVVRPGHGFDLLAKVDAVCLPRGTAADVERVASAHDEVHGPIRLREPDGRCCLCSRLPARSDWNGKRFHFARSDMTHQMLNLIKEIETLCKSASATN